MTIPIEEAEKKVAHLEYEALHIRYMSSVTSMGIEVAFKRCAKRAGGNVKRGTVWGRLTYHNIFWHMPMTRRQAIDWVALPVSIKNAKIDMQNTLLCAICGRQGISDRDHPGWERLHYQHMRMEICPTCVKNIWEKSHRPWEKN